MNVRTERDSFGDIEVPADHLWGAQTQRSLEFFRISTERMPPELILALAAIKRACALVNLELGLLPATKADAIMQAADEVLAQRHNDEFPLAIWQTGSGTQSNMNMNEVLANRASELLGAETIIVAAVPALCELAVGGTAVGTGLNTHPQFADKVAAELAWRHHLPLKSAPNKFAALAAHDALVAAHGTLKTLAAA